MVFMVLVRSAEDPPLVVPKLLGVPRHMLSSVDSCMMTRGQGPG